MNEKEWQLRLLTTWNEIAEPTFVQRWSELMEQSANAHVFFHPVLVNVWLETYRPIRDLQPLFVHATRGKQEVLFPLVLWRKNWKNAFVHVVVPAGHSDFDYHDPIFKNAVNNEEVDSFYESCLKALMTHGGFDQILLDGLHQQYVPKGWSVLHSEPSLQWSLDDVNVTNGFIFAQKKSEASNMNRRYKRLQELGDVSFKTHTNTNTGEAIRSLMTMLEHHSNRWPNAYKAPDFHRQMLLAGMNSELLTLTEIKLNEKPIAWQISFYYKRVMSLYMPALNKEFIKYSPGNLCHAYVFGWSKQAGMKTVDHLRGDEVYKSLWGGRETIIYDVVCNNKTLGSIVRTNACQTLKKINNLLKGRRK